MQQKHLFIMDPIEKLNLALDSSLRIALALARLGQKSYFCELGDLYWESGKGPQCQTRALNFLDDVRTLKPGESEKLRLDSFSSIHMRKDPPFDIHYITATWFLEQCTKTLVVNDPVALRGFNEKMGILQFPEVCKRSLVSAKCQQLFDFIDKRCEGDAVLKPLHLYGGRGILHIRLQDTQRAHVEELIREATINETSPILAQAFDRNIYEGEVRAFLVGGKAVSWCLKVPKRGEYLANTGSGATLHAYKPSSTLRKKVEGLGKELLKQKIYFVGLDIISDEITEINITSPRLLVAPGDSHDYYQDIANWLLLETK